jgi:lysozyme family protein
VNMGVRQAVALCQRAANAIAHVPIAEDGVVGPQTLAAMNACESSVLAAHLCGVCSGFYRHLADVRPEMQRYLAGWLARADKIPSGKSTAPGVIG